jgi:hypothetical protein
VHVKFDLNSVGVTRRFEYVDSVFNFEEITHVVTAAKQEETSFYDCLACIVVKKHLTALIGAVTPHYFFFLAVIFVYLP